MSDEIDMGAKWPTRKEVLDYFTKKLKAPHKPPPTMVSPATFDRFFGCDIKDCRKRAVAFDTPHNLCEEHKNLFDT